MKKAFFLNHNTSLCESTYQIHSTRNITIRIEQDNEDFKSSYWENGSLLKPKEDVFEFKKSQQDDTLFLLSRMYLPAYLPKAGIGRATLETFRYYTNAKVFARPNGDNSYDDGSHLTGDAPGFVAKMITEKLIVDNRENY